MNRTPRSEAARKVFESADRVFAAADEVFAEADHVFDSLPGKPLPAGTHRVRFSTDSLKARARLAWKFAKMAGAVLLTGKVLLTFKTSRP